MTEVPAELQFVSREEGDPAPEPMAFTLNGERFECYPVLPATRIVEHEIRVAGNNNLLYLREVLEYFEKAMPPEEWERFKAYLDDPANQIDMPVLGEMMRKVHTAYLTRPTKGPSPSPDGPETTGDTSTDASPSEDSTPGPSTAEGS